MCRASSPARNKAAAAISVARMASPGARSRGETSFCGGEIVGVVLAHTCGQLRDGGSGITEQMIEPTLCFAQRDDGVRESRSVGDVDLDESCADLLGDTRFTNRVAIEDRAFPATRGVLTGDRPADAARTAGDDREGSGEPAYSLSAQTMGASMISGNLRSAYLRYSLM